MKVRIMRGLPGSGKSFFASNILARMFKVEPTICSADHFFEKDGKYNFDPKKLPIAHKTCRQKFLEAIQRGDELIVVDNTNTMPTEMAFYWDLATIFTDDVQILAVEPPPMMERKDWLVQCEKMNQHGVPMKNIQAMFDRMKKHKIPYYWKVKQITREDGHFILEGKELPVHAEAT